MLTCDIDQGGFKSFSVPEFDCVDYPNDIGMRQTIAFKIPKGIR